MTIERVWAESPLVVLEIAGEPRPKSRPRVVRGGAYTPRATVEWEQTIRAEIAAAYPRMQPNETHEVSVRLRFATTTRQRRDIDNLAKLVLDACNGLVWYDDAQVVQLSVGLERGAPRPYTAIEIVTTGEARVLICATCGKSTPRRLAKQNERYCSKTCYDEAQRLGKYVFCVTCKKRIYRQNEKLRLYPNHYCSPECKRAAKTGTLICKNCRQEYTVFKNLLRHRAFCTPQCAESYYRGRMPADTVRPLGRCQFCGGVTSRADINCCRACFLQRSTR